MVAMTMPAHRSAIVTRAARIHCDPGSIRGPLALSPQQQIERAAAAMLGPRLGDGENPAPQRLGSEPPRHGGPQHTALALAAGAALALSGNHQETAITSAVAAFHEGDQGLMGFRLGVAVKVEAALDGKAATAKSPRGARVEPV